MFVPACGCTGRFAGQNHCPIENEKVRTGKPSARVGCKTKGHTVLDAIEKAVRKALEKGDAQDKNFRRRVYVSARHGLEQSMKGRKLKQDQVDDRFARLTEVAAMIENEFSAFSDEVLYPSPARRTYEAPAPLVEEVVETEEVPVIEELQQFDDPEIDQAVTELREAVSAGGDSEPEYPPKKTAKARKPAKPAPKSAKKEVKTEKVKQKAKTVSNTDLFGEAQPVWDKVQLSPETQTEDGADQLPGDDFEPGLPLLEPDLDGDYPDTHSVESSEETSAEPDALARPGTDEQISSESAVARSLEVGQETVQPPPLEPEPEAQVDLGDEVISKAHHEVRPLPANEDIPRASKKIAAGGPPRRGWAFLFILVTLLAFFIMAVWIALTTGALKMRGSETDVAQEVVTVAPQDRRPRPQLPRRPRLRLPRLMTG